MMVLTTLPFQGFYNSVHNSEIDDTFERIFSDSRGEAIPALAERAFDLVNWKAVFVEYAKEYAQAFSEGFKIKDMVFDELNSPKYYNYETDRIFVKIPLSEVKRIYSEVDKVFLEDRIKARFTSCTGFISHYSNKLSEWPEDLEEWDHNQVGTLLEAYANQESDDGFDSFAEYELMEGARGNGKIDMSIYENMKDQAERLFKIRDYLVEREERKYRVQK